MGYKTFVVDSWLIVVTFLSCNGVQFHEIMVALVRHGYENKVVILGGRVFYMSIVGIVELTTDQGVYSIGLAFFIESYGSIHVSMVCQGQGRHAIFLAFCYIAWN